MVSKGGHLARSKKRRDRDRRPESSRRRDWPRTLSTNQRLRPFSRFRRLTGDLPPSQWRDPTRTQKLLRTFGRPLGNVMLRKFRKYVSPWEMYKQKITKTGPHGKPNVDICVQRQQRKEIIFASGANGSGFRRPVWTKKSYRSCK